MASFFDAVLGPRHQLLGWSTHDDGAAGTCPHWVFSWWLQQRMEQGGNVPFYINLISQNLVLTNSHNRVNSGSW